MSAATISFTISAKVYFGDQFNFFFALDAESFNSKNNFHIKIECKTQYLH